MPLLDVDQKPLPTGDPLVAQASLPQQLDELVCALDSALAAASPRGEWLLQVHDVSMRLATLARHKPDAVMYYLIYVAGRKTERYSAHHSVLCATVCCETATTLRWPRSMVDSLRLAALTMNVSMRRLQDVLAASDDPLSDATRAEIEAHSGRSADMLEASRLPDRLCIDTVRMHHTDLDPEIELADLDPTQRLVRLVRRVDIFAAKLSRRGSRLPMSPVQAARHACLGPNDRPDDIGAALLKSVGLYPPGSLVKLQSGEAAIVLARGARADMPKVAALLDANGDVQPECPVRNTVMQRFAVRGAMTVDRLTVEPPHEHLMRLVV